MKSSQPSLPLTRREFLRSSVSGMGLLAFSGMAPAFLTRSIAAQVPIAERDRSILVLVQLAGGNDGLNTVIPFQDDQYYKLRPNIALKANDLLKLDGNTALHPDMVEMSELWKNGKLSIVQNVGYPNPNRSHFRSTEIWETAVDSNDTSYTGWVGRYLDATCAGSPESSDPNAVHIGGELPQACLSQVPHNIFGMPARGNYNARRDPSTELLEGIISQDLQEGNAGYLEQTLMDTLVTEQRVSNVINQYKPMAKYQNDALAQSLKRVAALISAGLETRVYFVKHGGFDTHANQLGSHARLLGQLSSALNAFQTDLEAHKLNDQVLTMTFSEFGRRPSENKSSGTDHGTSAPLFVMGSGVKDTLVGTPPSLDIEHNQDLKYSTDFRQVYSTVLNNWLKSDPTKVIEKPFLPLNFV